MMGCIKTQKGCNDHLSKVTIFEFFFSKINPYYTKQCDIGSFYGKQTQRILKMGPFLLYAQYNSVKPLLKPAQKNGI